MGKICILSQLSECVQALPPRWASGPLSPAPCSAWCPWPSPGRPSPPHPPHAHSPPSPRPYSGRGFLPVRILLINLNLQQISVVSVIWRIVDVDIWIRIRIPIFIFIRIWLGHGILIRDRSFGSGKMIRIPIDHYHTVILLVKPPRNVRIWVWKKIAGSVYCKVIRIFRIWNIKSFRYRYRIKLFLDLGFFFLVIPSTVNGWSQGLEPVIWSAK